MEIRQLRHFLAVYERRHYGRAAAHVGLSQSALTKSIAKLESSLQTKLFERGRYGAVPTPFGDSLAYRARIILAEERLATSEINDLKGAGRGTVYLGMAFSCAHRIVPRALMRLEKTHPGVSVIAVDGNTLLVGSRSAKRIDRFDLTSGARTGTFADGLPDAPEFLVRVSP